MAETPQYEPIPTSPAPKVDNTAAVKEPPAKKTASPDQVKIGKE
jgi:hypothetical protein